MKEKITPQSWQIMKFNKVPWRKRILISTATEGWIRYEWAAARYNQVIPVNWSAQGFDIQFGAIGYSIDDAYNLIANHIIEHGIEWLIIIEDDVLIPPDCFLKFSKYMEANDEPIVSGYYTTKSEPAEPLLFRGRGNGAFHDWKIGSKVTVDGMPMGCLLIHSSILKAMADKCELYQLADGKQVKHIFETPRRVSYDPQAGGAQRQEGTQDLYFFDRVIEYDILKKTGWKKAARRKWPFLCDTSIFCRHIDRQTGKQYPG